MTAIVRNHKHTLVLFPKHINSLGTKLKSALKSMQLYRLYMLVWLTGYIQGSYQVQALASNDIQLAVIFN